MKVCWRCIDAKQLAVLLEKTENVVNTINFLNHHWLKSWQVQVREEIITIKCCKEVVRHRQRELACISRTAIVLFSITAVSLHFLLSTFFSSISSFYDTLSTIVMKNFSMSRYFWDSETDTYFCAIRCVKRDQKTFIVNVSFTEADPKENFMHLRILRRVRGWEYALVIDPYTSTDKSTIMYYWTFSVLFFIHFFDFRNLLGKTSLWKAKLYISCIIFDTSKCSTSRNYF